MCFCCCSCSAVAHCVSSSCCWHCASCCCSSTISPSSCTSLRFSSATSSDKAAAWCYVAGTAGQGGSRMFDWNAKVPAGCASACCQADVQQGRLCSQHMYYLHTLPSQPYNASQHHALPLAVIMQHCVQQERLCCDLAAGSQHQTGSLSGACNVRCQVTDPAQSQTLL